MDKQVSHVLRVCRIMGVVVRPTVPHGGHVVLPGVSGKWNLSDQNDQNEHDGQFVQTWK